MCPRVGAEAVSKLAAASSDGAGRVEGIGAVLANPAVCGVRAAEAPEVQSPPSAPPPPPPPPRSLAGVLLAMVAASAASAKRASAASEECSCAVLDAGADCLYPEMDIVDDVPAPAGAYDRVDSFAGETASTVPAATAVHGLLAAAAAAAAAALAQSS